MGGPTRTILSESLGKINLLLHLARGAFFPRPEAAGTKRVGLNSHSCKQLGCLFQPQVLSCLTLEVSEGSCSCLGR